MKKVAVGSLVAVAAVAAPVSPRAKIEQAVQAAPAHRLRKAEMRPALKKIFPLITTCYSRELHRDPTISGVVNTKLTLLNDPNLGMTLSVTGFDTDGKLGESKDFLACVTKTFEAKIWPAIDTRGRAEFFYPGTFSPDPVSDRDKPIVDRADQQAKDGKWADALETARQGLKDVSLEGPLRRQLIGIAGVAACHLKDEATARHYYLLSTPEYEPGIETSCQDASVPLE
ncbi:MAG TPA: hypothetical protein VGC41_08490 [Kofleriaceae bacterium]